MLLHFVEIYLKILLNYNSTIFFAKFRTKEAQESTNLDRIRQANAVQICRIMRSEARHNSIDPRLVSFCRKKLNALLLKN